MNNPDRSTSPTTDLDDRVRQELLKIQGLLTASIEASPAGILIADAPDVRIRMANSAALGIRGGGSELLTEIPSELHPQRWQTFHPDGRPTRPEELPLSRAVLNGETVAGELYIIRRTDGEDRWVMAHAAPVRDEHGKVVAGVVVFPDVTEMRAAEAERDRLRDRMVASQRFESLALLAGGLAHDFNNILATILGEASVAILDLPTSHAHRETLERIQGAAEVAAGLTKQLMAYTGRAGFDVEDLDLGELVRGSEPLFRASIAKKVDFVLQVENELPTVRVDRSQIHQLLLNLLINASESHGDRGGTIRLSVRPCDLNADLALRLLPHVPLPPGRYLCVEVADSGGGIDPAIRTRIFEPFFSTKSERRGLGLAACLGIVGAHLGGIEVDAGPRGGSVFRVFLPTVDRPVRHTQASVGILRGEALVMVVDDEEGVREAATRILRRYGYRVLTAVDGPQALELMQEHGDAVELVLMDMSMPRMTGPEVAEMMRRSWDPAVLFTSGYPSTDSMVFLRESERVSYLQKPYTAEQLAERVQDLLLRPKSPVSTIKNA